MSEAIGQTSSDVLREVDLPAVDIPLREDVRRLGALVGEVLAEQEGQAFLDEVERVRQAAIRRREQNAPIEAIEAELRGLPLDQAEGLVRAFATYFSAVNLAERVHRIRRRRDYQRAGSAPQPGGLEAVLSELKAADVSRDTLIELLGRLRIEPVFTAHPTEAVRRVLLEKEREIVRCLVDDMDRRRTPQERHADTERIRLALASAWQTAETPPQKPTVADELEHVGFYLSESLYQVLPVFYEVFEQALRQAYGDGVEPPTVLGFGSWVGGDMDGNPNVGADTIAASLATQRAWVLGNYRRDCAHLGDVLTQSPDRVGIADGIGQRIAQYANRLPEAAEALKARHSDMPYRQLLALMAARLAATEAGEATGYEDVDGFLGDLRLIDASLAANRGEHAGRFALRRLIRRAECFGFHLATLDLRQDSAVHEAALASLLHDADWPERPAAERAGRLRVLIETGSGVLPRGDEIATRTLDVFRTVAEALPRFGPRAFGPYIVSMSRSAADALAVLALARIAGCVSGDGSVPLDVAPLFETVDDLAAAPDTLRSLFDDPVYRLHLAARGGRQIVMLGYSDSAKDGGIVASRWALQRTQVALTELARESGIRIAFFHGRGGSLSRGGGKTERAVIAAPRGSVDGYLRVTEQGEVIHRKYGIRSLALRNLEQATGAVLRASLRPRPPEAREERWRQIAADIAQRSRRVYRGLVYEDPQFPAYFRAATPIDVIERLRIGSRPAKRGSAGGVESLRAIPWVFAWSQNRAGLTAWFGLGSALSETIEAHGLEPIAEMARDWPFFAALIDDVEMVLAKSDLAIFERYSRLAGELHEDFYARIAAEFDRTREAVLALKDEPDLLQQDYRLRQSIRLRNPYVDPLSLLQVDLLRRWREADRPEDALFHALATTVNGIAAGIQNTG